MNLAEQVEDKGQQLSCRFRPVRCLLCVVVCTRQLNKLYEAELHAVGVNDCHANLLKVASLLKP